MTQAGGIALRQFQHTAWSMQNGAPSQIDALAQTTDGYLWLGTVNGLFRFDGVTFEAVHPRAGQHFLQTSISSLTATPDGGLWIGYTFGRIDFLKRGELQEQRFEGLAAWGTIYSIVTDVDGSTWAATVQGLLHLVNGVWRDADEILGLKIASCYSLRLDSRGTLWLTTDDFIYRLPRGARRFESTGIAAGSRGIIRESPEGTLWLSDGVGLSRVQDWRPERGKIQQRIPVASDIVDFQFDAYGSPWFTQETRGVTRVREVAKTIELPASARRGSLERFGTSFGLTSDSSTVALIDREGNMWIGTPNGLDRFRRSIVDPAPVPDTFLSYALANAPDGAILIGTQNAGLYRLFGETLTRVKVVTQKRVVSMFRAADGKLWLGGYGDLGYLEGDRYKLIPLPSSLLSPKRDTQTLTSGLGGDLWMQVSTVGKSLWKLRTGEWFPALKAPADPQALILASDHTGRVWAGYLNNVVRVFQGENVTKLSPAEGITVGNVTAIQEFGTNMWIGGEHGIEVMLSGKPVAVKFAGVVPIDGVSGMLQGHDGALWINSLSGLLRVSAEDVARFLKDPSFRVPYELFNYLDGISGKAPQMRPLPSIIQGTGNTIWFTTTNGVFSIDAANIFRNRLVPPVSIASVIVDDKPLEGDGPIHLPQGASRLQINYAALSLSMPERVLFRYRLEGFDKEWQDVGTRRQAFYSHLPPGHYVFHVIACNNDGFWNDVGATLPITLPPTFIQSWYFKFIAAVLAIVVLWFLVSLRARQETSKMRGRLAERFNERQRIARDLHDTLLQDLQALIFKFSVATKKLPQREPVRPVFEAILAQSDSVLSEGRSLITNLHAFGDSATDLRIALKSFGDELHRLHPSTSFVFEENGKARELTTHVSRELSFLIREALTNAFRHADATHVWVTLSYSQDGFALQIRDDGCGINESIFTNGSRPGHWGLRNMKERAERLGGHYILRSSMETGTTVVVTLSDTAAYIEPSHTLLGRLRHFFTPRQLLH